MIATPLSIISDVMESLRFSGSMFFHSDLAAPWGMSLNQTKTPRFHILLKGDCVVGSAEERPIQARHMDMVMIPNGIPHWIADTPGRKLIPSEQAAEACELQHPLFQHGEITHRLMCGVINYDEASFHPLLDSLPSILHFQNLTDDNAIWMTIRLIDKYLEHSHGLQNPVVDRLTEALFLQLLAESVDWTDKDPIGFLAAIRDSRIRNILSLIHRNPQEHWTLESLSRKANMSRSTLAKHFQESIGIGPITYVNDWRIMKAYNMIRHSGETLENIAGMLGFASVRTLNKAFQRNYKKTPTEVRKELGKKH